MSDLIKQIEEPKIKLDPIKFEAPDNEDDTKKITKGLGFTPFLWYMGYQIRETDISNLKLYHNGILPQVILTFVDAQSFIEDIGFPENDTPFEVFLNSGSDTIKSIHLKFKVVDFKQVTKGSGSKKYTMSGTLDLTELYVQQYKSYSKKTSFGAIKDICKEVGLGFNSNISDTKDEMTWLQRESYLEFIVNAIKRSYLSDDSYLIGYIDYYYCFNYIDVEKEFKRDISKDFNIDTNGTNAIDEENVEEKATLEFTNDKGQSGTNLFISKYNTKNKSMSTAIKNGFMSRTRYYDILEKNHLMFNIDSLTDDGDDVIVLRGKTDDEEYYKKNVSNSYLGKIDTDNVHKNYAYSMVQNKLNLDNITKISMDLTIPNLNWSIYRYQKVVINIVPESSTPIKDDVTWKLTGEWIIIGLNYLWKGGKMEQGVSVSRRSLGKNPNKDLPINNI
jgi:hypothetical protein